jgi:hypothetical protein
MSKRRCCFWLLVALLVGAAVIGAILEPTGTVPALLAGEPFYRGRPTRYWREVLREEGRSGKISTTTASKFLGGHEAFPVLRECARDSDRNVRWTAITLLGNGGLRTQQLLDLLVEALDDGDVEVRLKSVGALARWGPMAKQAVPALTARLQDPELQVAHFADLVLWHIDPTAAVSACGWRPFTSSEYGFSVMLPGQPEQKDTPVLEGQVIAHSFQEWHRGGPYQAPVRYVILVAEYSEELVKQSTEEERFQAMKDCAPHFFNGGKVVEEKKVSREG